MPDFEFILNRIEQKLRKIAKKVNMRYSFFDEDDLYQEALIHLWEKFKKGEISDKTDSYILQGCFFFLKNYIRVICKKTDLCSLSLEGLNDESGGLTQDKICAKGGDDQFNFIMMDILVEDILVCLSERERKVFLLTLDQLTVREIAEHIGVSHVMVVKIEKKIREKCENIKNEVLNKLPN